MRKTPGVAFCMHKMQTTKKTELYELIDDIPMKIKDYYDSVKNEYETTVVE